jgi:hypothetical protein
VLDVGAGRIAAVIIGGASCLGGKTQAASGEQAENTPSS